VSHYRKIEVIERVPNGFGLDAVLAHETGRNYTLYLVRFNWQPVGWESKVAFVHADYIESEWLTPTLLKVAGNFEHLFNYGGVKLSNRTEEAAYFEVPPPGLLGRLWAATHKRK